MVHSSLFSPIFFYEKLSARKVSRELDSSAKESAWGPGGGGKMNLLRSESVIALPALVVSPAFCVLR